MPDSVREPIRDCCLGKSPWPLFLCGEAGSGKTCTTLVMLDFWSGYYSRFPDWCEMLRDAELGNYRNSEGFAESRSDIWNRWKKANFPVMDEIGLRSTASDFQGEVLLQALDSREGYPAVFISNLDLPGIHNSYDDRIASRLAGGTVVKMTGDMRVAKR